MDLVFEIGTEELPASFQKPAVEFMASEIALRFPGAVILATVLAAVSRSDLPAVPSTNALVFVMMALLLIVFPIYVNQVGIALASPLTVRVVLAAGPVLLFFLQLIEGRLASSPYSLAAAVFYAVFAIAAALARRHAIRSALPATRLMKRAIAGPHAS